MRNRRSRRAGLEELGGLRDEKGGRIGREIPSEPIRVPPRLEIVGSRLLWWDDGAAGGRATERTPDSSMLEEFVRLADAEAREEAILHFARAWGVFPLCRHNLPAGHEYVTGRGSWVSCGSLRVMPGESGCYWEPLDAWHAIAKRARAILGVAAGVFADRLVDSEDLTVIDDPNL